MNRKTPPPARDWRLEGVYNLRDIGGYVTAEGRTVRWRMLYRSDSLHRLSNAAQSELLERGVRTIVDLRYGAETSESVSVFANHERVRYVNIPLLLPPGDGPFRNAGSGQEVPTLQAVYRHVVDERGPMVAAVFAELSGQGSLPAVVHCTAGKDRTGVIVALTLRLLGVAAETVAADYSLTDANLAGEWMNAFRRESDARGVQWARIEGMMEAPAHEMLSLIGYLEQRYGGIHHYLSQAGVTAQQLADLQAQLLE